MIDGDDVDVMARLEEFGARRREALSASRLSPEVKELIVRAVASRVPVVRVAEAAGVSRRAVYNVLEEARE